MPLHYCVVHSDAAFVDADRFAELVREAFSIWGADVRDDGECTDVVQGDGRNQVGWGGGRPSRSPVAECIRRGTRGCSTTHVRARAAMAPSPAS